MKRHEEEAKRQGPKTKKNKEVALVYLHIPLPQYENLDPVAGREAIPLKVDTLSPKLCALRPEPSPFPAMPPHPKP